MVGGYRNMSIRDWDRFQISHERKIRNEKDRKDQAERISSFIINYIVRSTVNY